MLRPPVSPASLRGSAATVAISRTSNNAGISPVGSPIIMPIQPSSGVRVPARLLVQTPSMILFPLPPPGLSSINLALCRTRLILDNHLHIRAQHAAPIHHRLFSATHKTSLSCPAFPNLSPSSSLSTCNKAVSQHDNITTSQLSIFQPCSPAPPLPYSLLPTVAAPLPLLPSTGYRPITAMVLFPR